MVLLSFIGERDGKSLFVYSQVKRKRSSSEWKKVFMGKYHFRGDQMKTSCSFKCFYGKCISVFPSFGCRWSQTYGEGGYFSVRIQMTEATSDPSCIHKVDKTPNNAYLRKCPTLMKTAGWRNKAISRIALNHTAALMSHSDSKRSHVEPLIRSLPNWVSKEQNHSACPHLLCSSSRPSPGTWCVLIR